MHLETHQWITIATDSCILNIIIYDIYLFPLFYTALPIKKKSR